MKGEATDSKASATTMMDIRISIATAKMLSKQLVATIKSSRESFIHKGGSKWVVEGRLVQGMALLASLSGLLYQEMGKSGQEIYRPCDE